MATEKLDVILRLIAGDYKKEAREAATATGQIGTSAQRAGTSAAAGFNLMKAAVVGVVGAGLVQWARGAVESLARIERIGAQTEAAIKSTGGAANVTREEIDDLAGSLENLTSIEAESITEGQNLLLTFTNIRNEVGEGNDIFDQTTKLMVDMSVAMGTDAAGGAIQLGKALNDPVAGLTALTRVGIQFTAEQKKQIQGFVETNDIMSAQKVILAELTRQFGGSAEALGDTFAGRVDLFEHALGTMAETALTVAIPALEDLVVRGTEVVDLLGPMSAVAAKAKATLASLATDGIDLLAQKTPAAVTALQAAFQSMGALVDAGPLLAETLGVINEQLEFTSTEWGELRRAVASGLVDLGLTNGELTELVGLLQAEEAALSTISRSGHGHAIEDIADAQFRLGQETSRTTDEIKAQRDEVRAAIDPLFALRKAADENRAAQIAMHEAIREFGPASVEAKDAALELISTQADLNYYAELYSANFGPAQEAAFRKVAREAGLTNDQIEEIIRSTDALNNKQVNVYFTLHEKVLREAIEDNLIGGKQHGGPVWKDRPYIVGEAGRELFVPNTSGSIVSNSQLMAALGRSNVVNNKTGPTIVVQSPMKEFRSDLQYATILASVTNLVEGL